MEVFDAPVITQEDKLWLSSVLSLTTTISFWYLAESGAHQVGGINPFDVTAIRASLTGPTNAFRMPNLALEGFKIGSVISLNYRKRAAFEDNTSRLPWNRHGTAMTSLVARIQAY